jgi:mRNA interferase MazF
MDDFDLWMKKKRKLNNKTPFLYLKQREVWWCAYGHNVGVEMNGKGTIFQRPVLVLKVINFETLFVIPFTTEEKDDKYHIPYILNNERVWLALAQGRTISSRRLLTKEGKMDKDTFGVVQEHFIQMYS